MDYTRDNIRKPVVSGQFYEGNFNNLNKQIETCFYSNKGPGELPIKRRLNKLIGVISPHAGYFFSGPCASWAYMEIAESEFPHAYVILGPNHYNVFSGLSKKDWETPLGIIKTEKEIIKLLEEKTNLKVNESCHEFEHSIEVQLPFLQFASRDRLDDLRIVPISLGHDIEFRDIGKQLYNVFFNLLKNKKIVFIISSDFTHYGRNYGYLPFTSDIKKRIYDLDNGAIELIKKIDVIGLKEYLNNTGITICGYIPILVFLSMLNEMKEKENKNIKSIVLMHYTSGDVIGDFKNSVSYVSMAFR
ncbi:MAG: AmmeMemoRadiSam system protein B [Candidatus Woesearchaeota archaeon]